MTIVQSGPVEYYLWATGALIFYNVFNPKILIQNSTYEDTVAVPFQQY